MNNTSIVCLLLLLIPLVANCWHIDGVDVRHIRRGGAQSDDLMVQKYACFDGQALAVRSRPCDTSKKSYTVASAKFKNAINETGWAYLEVTSNSSFPDITQAYAAGVIESVITRKLIKSHLTNTYYTDCDKPKTQKMRTYCQRLTNYLKVNLDYLTQNAKAKGKTEPYWHQVELLLYQLTGLNDAYIVLDNDLDIEDTVFTQSIDKTPMMLYVQLAGDIMDLEQALGKPKHLWRKRLGFGSCSALVKPTDDNKDLFVSHDTWSTYQSMLRILKAYNLPYKMTGNSHEKRTIPSPTLTFSSYPATLFSIDDFYTTSNGLVVQETTIECMNKELYKKFVRPQGTILTWMRTMIATRLATGAKQWTDLFAMHNSGTYNNQWMVIDYNKFKPGHPLPRKDLFYVLEQMPGHIAIGDMSAHLADKRYWPSYNSPYFHSIQNVSGAKQAAEQKGDWFSYDKTPRALIFKQRHSSVQNMASLRRLMRYNNYKVDPLSRCNCTPPYSAENAIAARCDLNPKNGTYPFAALGHRSHGAIDMKAVSHKDIARQSFVAESGPTHDQLPVFEWHTADFASTTPHAGHPDRWEFAPVHVKWSVTKARRDE